MASIGLICFIFSAFFPEFFISGLKWSKTLDEGELNEESLDQ